MTEASDAFFDKLRVVGRVDMLARVNGSMRVELTEGRKTSKTQITVRRGHVSVGPAGGEADCMIYAPMPVWDALVTGQAQPMTAFLRGAMVAAGDAAMLVLMRRLFSIVGQLSIVGQRGGVAPARAAGDRAEPGNGRAGTGPSPVGRPETGQPGSGRPATGQAGTRRSEPQGTQRGAAGRAGATGTSDATTRAATARRGGTATKADTAHAAGSPRKAVAATVARAARPGKAAASRKGRQ
jgi:putative sterol carrier protein